MKFDAILAILGTAALTVGVPQTVSASDSVADVRVAQAGHDADHDESAERATPHAPGRHFRATDIDEPGAGGHHHAAVTVDDLALLVIRDEGAYKTPRDRAESVARALEESLHQGDRIFVFDAGATQPGVYVASHHGAYPRLVLRVTPADAAAYSRRSGHVVSQDVLGEWWTALIEDFVAVLFLDRSPAVVSSTHEGAALVALRSRLSQMNGDSGPPETRAKRAAAALSFDVREQLRFLAFAVPDEFTHSLVNAPADRGPSTREPL